MNSYLLITVYGVQCSWGSTSRGPNTRPTDLLPTRSALIGAAGAAMGARQDSKEIRDLHHDLDTAVKVEHGGSRERDYQTTTIVNDTSPSFVKRIFRRTLDRKSLLDEMENAGKLGTNLSDRYYLTDAVYTVAYASRNGKTDLNKLAQRFRKPVFPIYLGRKNFLPAVDFMPEVVEESSFVDALMQRNSLEAIREQVPEDADTWFHQIKTSDKVLIAVPESTGNGEEWAIARNDHCFDPALRAFSGRKEYRTYVDVEA